MALDFPSNPTDGQIYGNYQWSSSSGAWKSVPSSKTVSVVSATAPTSANNGDIWIDSTDGTSFYYYDDGNTKQWVELISSGIPSTPVSVASGGTGATTASAAVTALGAVSQTNGTVTTASTSSGVVRNIYTSTSAPSGGIDGDIWLVYV